MEYKSFKEILDNPIDIKNGDLTYGNYIAIKNCIRNLNNDDEVKTITDIIKLYNYELQTNDFKVIVPFIENKFQIWYIGGTRSNDVRSMVSTTEEIRAGILNIQKR